MEKSPTVSSMIDMWPSRKALAVEVGVPVDRVHKWHASASIPARFHQAVLDAARLRGFPVTADDIVKMHARAIERDVA